MTRISYKVPYTVCYHSDLHLHIAVKKYKQAGRYPLNKIQLFQLVLLRFKSLHCRLVLVVFLLRKMLLRSWFWFQVFNI